MFDYQIFKLFLIVDFLLFQERKIQLWPISKLVPICQKTMKMTKWGRKKGDNHLEKNDITKKIQGKLFPISLKNLYYLIFVKPIHN